MSTKSYNDYPKKKTGDYSYECAHCGRSVPAINGELKNHYEWCEYRKGKELQEEKELLEIEVKVLKIDLNSPVYGVYSRWCIDEVACGDDISKMKLFRQEKDALAYKEQLQKELEKKGDFNQDTDEICVEIFPIQ